MPPCDWWEDISPKIEASRCHFSPKKAANRSATPLIVSSLIGWIWGPHHRHRLDTKFAVEAYFNRSQVRPVIWYRFLLILVVSPVEIILYRSSRPKNRCSKLYRLVPRIRYQSCPYLCSPTTGQRVLCEHTPRYYNNLLGQVHVIIGKWRIRMTLIFLTLPQKAGKHDIGWRTFMLVAFPPARSKRRCAGRSVFKKQL